MDPNSLHYLQLNPLQKQHLPATPLSPFGIIAADEERSAKEYSFANRDLWLQQPWSLLTFSAKLSSATISTTAALLLLSWADF